MIFLWLSELFSYDTGNGKLFEKVLVNAIPDEMSADSDHVSMGGIVARAAMQGIHVLTRPCYTNMLGIA